MTLPEKLELLSRYGVDEVIAVPFTAEFAARPKSDFLGDLRSLRPLAVVVGEDFHFGKDRGGSVDDLRQITRDVTALPMHSLGGEDIKSTRIREFLRTGDVAGARRFLGRHYSAQGVVVQGDQLGRTLGFPTANVQVALGKALPRGVFAVRVQVESGGVTETYGGMANIGTRPTVSGLEARFEVNLLDFGGNLYGKELQVKFFSFIRAEQKFGGLDELKAQLLRDQASARALLESL